MEESQENTNNREVANATQDVRSAEGLDGDIDLQNQMHSYPNRINRNGANASNMSSKNHHKSPSVKQNLKRKIPAGIHARSNSTDSKFTFPHSTSLEI